ncbi:hypothetical protein ACFO0N_15210 [Halobium salinum]|uniref:Uncharacterized protein n=1 Tax=Halobium salinum TaxID=1364940 RepID=A0ABD5PF08_9EURY|nr:hypothetical protein [Halobium salinum]
MTNTVDEIFNKFPAQDSEEDLIELVDSILKGSANQLDSERFQEAYSQLNSVERAIFLAYLSRCLRDQAIEKVLSS